VTVLGWVLFGVAAYVVVVVVAALAVGAWLRNRGGDYPAPEDGPS